MASTQAPKEYVLGELLKIAQERKHLITYESTYTLNLQHFLYPKIFGYLLHPDIPRGENLKIADVGTGSGIWMLDIADELPKSTDFHGYDINISQAPPSAWLPPNVRFSELDITKDIPEHLQGQYDIVNLRLFLIVVKNNDPAPIISNLFKLLKPGGWLQWTEAHNSSEDYTNFSKADPAMSGEALKRLDQTIVPQDGRFRPTWPMRLPDYFRKVGFVDVAKEVKLTEDFRHWLAFTNDIVTATYMEIINNMSDGPAKQELADLCSKATQESFGGVAWNAPRINVIGRKPEL